MPVYCEPSWTVGMFWAAASQWFPMTRSLADDSPERPLVEWQGRHLALDDTLERQGLGCGDVVRISVSDIDDLCDIGPPPGLEPPRVLLQ